MIQNYPEEKSTLLISLNGVKHMFDFFKSKPSQ